MSLSMLAGKERLCLGNGFDLRLLSALEVLQARREGSELAEDGRELALCSNACLLARALERSEDQTPVFSDGKAVLAGMTAEEIARLAGERPRAGPAGGRAGTGKKKLRDNPGERLRWRVLRQFGALPTESRVRAMKGRDYLWCLVNGILDREEALERLCPTCRTRALEERCSACGRPAGDESTANAAFDLSRFEQLKGGTRS